MAGFFFPHGFFTGVLQTYARKYQYPVDLLSFEFIILDAYEPSQITKGPKDGVYVYGLFMENAKWDPLKRRLVEPELGEMQLQFPAIHFDPRFRPKELVGSEGTSG
jgi:dynein heavy chain